MKNPPGLVHIETGGSANTTMITIDDVVPMVKRCTIIIDPKQGENQIKLHTWSRQNNKMYEDGKVQSFHGISSENYEFVKALFAKLTLVTDAELDEAIKYARPMPSHVIELLRIIKNARTPEKTDE